MRRAWATSPTCTEGNARCASIVLIAVNAGSTNSPTLEMRASCVPDPASPDAADAFYAYAYERRNVPGVMQELWYHAAGCHAWLVVSRDTRTHEISEVKLAQDVALERQKVAGTAP